MISGRHWNDHEWLGIIPKRPIFRQIEEPVGASWSQLELGDTPKQWGASWSYEFPVEKSPDWFIHHLGNLLGRCSTLFWTILVGIFVNGKHENLWPAASPFSMGDAGEDETLQPGWFLGSEGYPPNFWDVIWREIQGWHDWTWWMYDDVEINSNDDNKWWSITICRNTYWEC